MKKNSPIAVVGMSGIFPGAPDLDRYWSNIENGVDCIQTVPDERWIVEPDRVTDKGHKPDGACSRRAGLVSGFRFDPSGFEMDGGLLAGLDPMHHLILTAGRDALSEVRFSGKGAAGEVRKRTGVIVASIALPTDSSSRVAREILGSSFEKKVFGKTISNDERLSESMLMAGRVTGYPASLLARSLGLGGGSYTLDAACSSSLYAIKLACDELRSGRTDMMLAGGVSRPESLFTQVGFTQLTALSPSGRCAPFDKDANGLVVGEGAGVIVLKRLEDALRDSDRIRGLIHGAGLSNDMRGNLLAPDTEGQVRAMRLAYEATGWSPFDVDHIECHGTGTPVGDTMELKSLKTLWGDSGWSAGQCALGSVKSMIGHLLTGAGIAGTVKSLLALENKVIPPSLNFNGPADNSPLHNSPFRVQTKASEWKKRNPFPRRAAMSAFGFGGINAHILMEEWQQENTLYLVPREIPGSENTEEIPVAVVGMGTCLGSLENLNEFKEALFRGESAIKQDGREEWADLEEAAKKYLGELPAGNFIRNMKAMIGEFHIPPNEIPRILPQHLLMLKASAMAIDDAGMPRREDRPRMGAAIGMGYDNEAGNVHIRWNLANEIEKWNEKAGLNLGEDEKEKWLSTLETGCCPPLDATGTTGALGGLIASRVAREFRLGGPCFTVSNEDASGLTALDIGIESIRNNETDVCLAGAVDLPGEIRQMVWSNHLRPYSGKNSVAPFDRDASGPLPGEGAAAVILKRLDRAVEDNDRIYCVIKGCGKSTGCGPLTEEAYARSLDRAFKATGIEPASVSYVETHGSGDPTEDRVEYSALTGYFGNKISEKPERPNAIALGSVIPTTGHAGAVAGLTSFIKTSLCLYHEIIPPLPGFTCLPETFPRSDLFNFPRFPQYWMRNRDEGPRRACVASVTPDGNVSHVILEGIENSLRNENEKSRSERLSPLGSNPGGLFVIEGNTPEELTTGLERLSNTLAHLPADSHDMEKIARTWHKENRPDNGKKHAVAIVAGNVTRLGQWIAEAVKAVKENRAMKISGPDGVRFTPEPLGPAGEVAFVYPGSGNHYVGMGRGIGTCWPEILRDMDQGTEKLKTQLIPSSYVPHRISWEDTWEEDALAKVNKSPLDMIFGQVSHGGLMTNLVRSFSIQPEAVISYSLGESAGFFAMNVWPERGTMLERMENSTLFTTELAGPCHAARKMWNIPKSEELVWKVALVNRPAPAVKNVIENHDTAYLLIVNTPDECVIGGREEDVKAVVAELKCEAVYLEGVVTVHCNAAVPEKEAYRNLHLFPTNPPENIRFYSGYLGASHAITRESAAESILNQALYGFDFSKTIEQAYEDGVRVFVEMGPASSCTRMITRILEGKPHAAVSACVKGESDYLTILKMLGTLASERVPVDLDKLYGDDLPSTATAESIPSAHSIPVSTGIRFGKPALPVKSPPLASTVKKPADPKPLTNTVEPAVPEEITVKTAPGCFEVDYPDTDPGCYEVDCPDTDPGYVEIDFPEPEDAQNEFPFFTEAIDTFTENNRATADAHEAFLEFSSEVSNSFAQTMNLQTELLEQVLNEGDETLLAGISIENPFTFDEEASPATPEFDGAELKPATEAAAYVPEPVAPVTPEPVVSPAFSREMCMEFATGSLEKVLGPRFAIVDTYPVRVRLPDEPLMLVDRIMKVDGEKGSLKSGRVVTEHDVLPGAWYLDGDRSPVCISIEAGQADLFLCSYLGIDLAVEGERSYRLLDAVATFHGGLPRAGETIRYDIEIERFIKQGKTYLFFFHFNGYIGDNHIISMRNGCAGFFTDKEVSDSGGIILTPEEKMPVPGKRDSGWRDLVDFRGSGDALTLDDNQVNSLRNGNLEAAFGTSFKGLGLSPALCLPSGRMSLVHRVKEIAPDGGRYGLGAITAEADIHPNDWFLTCHFVDDMVMPGTLMYECCMHTLRIFIMRMGWVTDNENVCIEPVPEVSSILKCRGPVTADTRKVNYRVEVKEIGYNPEPYVIADAHMYGDGRHIVMFRDMSLKLSHATREEIEKIWFK